MWSAGCAGGQEAYTVAMVFAELLGIEAFRERVKIYATDVDEDALNQARTATYNAKETESLPPELRDRYFERADQRLAFRKDLRRTVIFGRNNLVADAPISRLDLLICRNTLMYFTAETQGRILRALPLRAQRPRRADARQVGDDGLPPGSLRPRRPQEAHLRQAAADDGGLARRRVRQRRDSRGRQTRTG